jgi:hypothetical protein
VKKRGLAGFFLSSSRFLSFARKFADLLSWMSRVDGKLMDNYSVKLRLS